MKVRKNPGQAAALDLDERFHVNDSTEIVPWMDGSIFGVEKRFNESVRASLSCRTSNLIDSENDDFDLKHIALNVEIKF